MSDPFICPRRVESFQHPDLPDKDHWREDRTCSYCGSIHPDDLFSAIDNGQFIEPTDKSYKIYVADGKNAFSKFYFQHLDEEQQNRFVDLLNAGKIKLEYPGRFYVLPFFIAKK